PDTLDSPPPEESIISQYYDFFENTFLHRGAAHRGPAENVNTLGEVPNSSWYTNRHYRRRMSIAELMRGPNQSDGPDTTHNWLIIKGKGQGITPGFTIKDARGDLYLIKFDPLTNPEMATAAEVICTKFFYALGYNVPENYLTYISPEKLVLSPTATVKDIFGNKRPLTPDTLEAMLSRVPRDGRGYFRVIASKFLSGKPVGPFRYYGTRPDDPNDVIPHEARRELRGLRVFCAWLNHDDSRSVNTLDMYVEEDGRHFVRHYLIDFGSTLGSGSVKVQSYRAGNEYIFELTPILKSLFTLGLWVRPWVKVKYPPYPSIGRFEGDFFDPRKWKPEYPNPAFNNCDGEDAFWAAKQVMHFTDEEIRAIVSTGQLSDKAAEAYLVRTLIKRRDKIGQAYLRFGGGLDRFRVNEENRLQFEDLPAQYGLEPSGRERRIRWQTFDNLTGKAGKVLHELHSRALRLAIPSTESAYLMVTIETPGVGTTRVFLRREGEKYAVVGVRREAFRK
ncbi:MAG: hypothetical protein D6681_07460, partial [Calditrichaeota bacterium]